MLGMGPSDKKQSGTWSTTVVQIPPIIATKASQLVVPPALSQALAAGHLQNGWPKKGFGDVLPCMIRWAVPLPDLLIKRLI